MQLPHNEHLRTLTPRTYASWSIAHLSFQLSTKFFYGQLVQSEEKDFVKYLKNLLAGSLIKEFNKGVQAAADATYLNQNSPADFTDEAETFANL